MKKCLSIHLYFSKKGKKIVQNLWKYSSHKLLPDRSADLSTGRGETTAALTFPGLSLSHAKSCSLGLTPWRTTFLQKPENVCLGSQALCSDQDALMGLPVWWGWGERVLAPWGPLISSGSYRRG